MAAMESIDRAGADLEEAVLDIGQIVEAFAQLAGDNQPPWLFTVWRRVRKVDELTQAYMAAVHEHARPVLNDMAALTKSSGSGR